MWIMAANFSGDFYFEVLHDGGTVNADRYLQFLEAVIKFFSQKLDIPGSQLCMMHEKNDHKKSCTITRDLMWRKS